MHDPNHRRPLEIPVGFPPGAHPTNIDPNSNTLHRPAFRKVNRPTQRRDCKRGSTPPAPSSAAQHDVAMLKRPGDRSGPRSPRSSRDKSPQEPTLVVFRALRSQHVRELETTNLSFRPKCNWYARKLVGRVALSVLPSRHPHRTPNGRPLDGSSPYRHETPANQLGRGRRPRESLGRDTARR